MSEPFTNARVHEYLTAALDAAVADMHANRLQLNSAALWWFLNPLTPQERAEILGEYVKQLAMRGQVEADEQATGNGRANGRGSDKGAAEGASAP
jgi:hypothetical protein